MLRMTATRAMVAMAILLMAGCGSDDSGTDEASSDVSTTTTSETGPGADSDISIAATVQVAEHAELGAMLVADDGRTLYLFERDEGTNTACTGACADNWPALAASEATAGDGVDASKLSTVDGQVPNHVVYNGHLLYRFAGDGAPGDVNGASIAAWFPIDPDGNKIESG
jgi:predicted lipoprotein with Yx(FWY)xxD motif